MIVRSLIMGVVALAAAGSVVAENTDAVLGELQLPVMVNQGDSYVEATEGLALQAGDRLMAMQGGSAQVQYANGCVQTLGSNEIAQVGTPESCADYNAAGTYQQAGSPTPTGGGSGTGTGTGTGAGATSGEIGAAILAAGVGIGLAVEAQDDNDVDEPEDPPISP